MKNFFYKKKVFITGHTGFKGIWLVSILNHFNSKIYGFSKKDKFLENYKRLCKFPNVKNIYGNILDKKFLLHQLKKIKPEIIIHLAAQSIVQKSFEKPDQTIETNIIGTTNLLNSCRYINSIKTILIATSDKCYENKDKYKNFFKESDRLNGDDPYSASKACKEIIFNAYYKSYFESKNIGMVTVRAGNVIGGGDWSENRILPDCARSIIQNKDIIIRNPRSIRPWQHVLDVLNGYLLLIKKIHQSKNKKKLSGNYNFGPSEKKLYNVYAIVKIFLKKIETNKKIILNDKFKKKEKKYLLLSSKKSNKVLNWKPKLKLEEAIIFTSKWYKSFIKEHKNITNEQIKKFFKY